MYKVVQFTAQDGGSVSIVHEKWITPRKTEVYWPPVKEARAFDKLLSKNPSPDPKWKSYSIQRTFYETDELEKAKKKLKLVEVTSDVQSEDTADENLKTDSRPKRQTNKSKRLISSSDNDDYDDGLQHPPPLKKHLTEYVNLSLIDSPGSISQHDIQIDAHGVTPTKLKDINTEPIKTSGLQDKILSLLCQIKKQNDNILLILKDKECHTGTLNEEFEFPLKSTDGLNQCELLLNDNEKRANLIEYLKRIGGRDLSYKVSRVLKFLLTDKFATCFNFYGKRSNKKPFSQLQICAAVIEAIKVSTSTATEKNIEDCIKVWLKHAPERIKRISQTKDV